MTLIFCSVVCIHSEFYSDQCVVIIRLPRIGRKYPVYLDARRRMPILGTPNERKVSDKAKGIINQQNSVLTGSWIAVTLKLGRWTGRGS